MGRVHGKHGALYMSLNYGDLPSPVAFLSDWTINFAPSFNEVTAFGDPLKVYTASAVETSGDFAGYYDDSTRQFYAAVRDGLPRTFYLYPDTTDDPGQCWAGNMLPDFQVAGGIGNSVSVKASWKAAGPVSQLFFGMSTAALAGAGTAGTLPVLRASAVLAAAGSATAAATAPISPSAVLTAAGTAACFASVSGGGGLQDESGLAVNDEASAQLLDEG